MDLVVVSDEGRVVQVALRGRATQPHVAESGDCLVDLLGAGAYQRNVLLDLSETMFLDSSGVSWLLIAHKRFREQGGQFVICGVPPMVMKVLTMLRMQLVLEIAETLEEARQKVNVQVPSALP